MKILLISFVSLMVAAAGCKSSENKKPSSNKPRKGPIEDLDQKKYQSQLTIEASSSQSFTKGQSVRVPLTISGLSGSESIVAIVSAPQGASITNSQSSSPSFLWPTPTVGSTRVTVMVRDVGKCNKESNDCNISSTISSSEINQLYDAQTSFSVNVTNDGSGGNNGGNSGGGLAAFLPIILKILGGENGSSALADILPPEILKQLQGLMGNQVTSMTVNEFSEKYGDQQSNP